MRFNDFKDVRVSYVNDTRRVLKYSDVSLEGVVKDLRNERFAKGLEPLRNLLDNFDATILPDDGPMLRKGDLRVTLKGVPRVCFSVQMVPEGGVGKVVAYNSLVMLQISGLANRKEAEYVRESVSSVSYTLLAFIGANDRTVHIVCRAQAATQKVFNGLRSEEEGSHPKLLFFHANAYHQLRKEYSTQLGVNMNIDKPVLEMEWRMSADKDAYYNPDATPIVVDDIYRQEVYDFGLPTRGLEAIGMDPHDYCLRLYMSIVSKAMLRCADVTEDRDVRMVNQIAPLCRDAGLPIDFAVKMTSYNPEIDLTKEEIFSIFQTYYNKKIIFEGDERMLKSSDMIGLKTRRLLEMHYEFRMNSISGELQFRRRNLEQKVFQKLEDRDKKTMCELAVDSGLGLFDKDVSRFLGSSRIELFDPIYDFIDTLPEWDGEDRRTPLLQSITSDYSNMINDLSIWLRAMMVQWMGRNMLYGNSIMPVLIGPQGCGKTTFCKRLVPDELSEYFNDQISFKTEKDINSALTRYVLVIVDEFDSLSRGRHPQLKYLLTKTDVKGFKPYARTVTCQRRIGSFIATTNEPHPLTDQTGNRRFVCIPVTNIDNEPRINYPQFYAQIKHEVLSGMQSYFTDEDNKRIEVWNKRFLKVMDLQSMISNVFEKPQNCYGAPKMMLLPIAKEINKAYPNYLLTGNSLEALGRTLTKMGYVRNRTGGTGYNIRLKKTDF